MHRKWWRRAAPPAAAMAATLAFAASAQAHAVVSPPVAQKGVLQQFSLSVPTEKANNTTTKIELDVPAGFTIDSFEPAPGWTRQVQSTGSGEEAVVQRVTWTGGHVPTGEDAVFRFNGEAPNSQTYRFHVIQTYKDGSVADWSGPESSDSPAPTLQALDSLGGGSGGPLGIIALVVAGVALIVAAAGLFARGRALA